MTAHIMIFNTWTLVSLSDYSDFYFNIFISERKNNNYITV